VRYSAPPEYTPETYQYPEKDQPEQPSYQHTYTHLLVIVKNIYVSGRYRLRHTTHTRKEKGRDRVGRRPGLKRPQEPSGEVPGGFLEGLRSRPCGP
jgi:hypothetical protein